jgi:hypothetical protein
LPSGENVKAPFTTLRMPVFCSAGKRSCPKSHGVVFGDHGVAACS